MFEIVAVLALLGGLVMLIAAAAVVGFLLKVTFKLLVLPFWILGTVAKGVLYVVAGLLAVVAFPILLVLLLLLLPLVAFAGFVGAGIWALA